MKKSIILFFILLFVIQINTFSFSSKNISPNSYNLEIVPKIDNPTNAALQVLVKMKTGEIEKMLGRKLKFKEKLALKLFKLKTPKNRFDDTVSKDGRTSETLGIISIVSLFVFPLVSLPLAILAIVYGKKAKKKNPNDKKAHTGVVLGIVTLGLIALFAIALIIVLATFTLNWGG